MAKKLTRKQSTFVEAYLATGVASEAARDAFDIDPNNKQLAASIGHEYLIKPEIKKEITKRITPEMVESAHGSLLTAVRLDYFVFPKAMTDEEITGHVEAQGLTVINIRPSEKGKLAFFSLPDGTARGKGIELYHKVHGTFAPDKTINVNVDVAPNDRIKKLANKLNK
jgi:phage terminase small subunit